MIIALYEKSASGQSGVAVLTARGDDTEVVINVSPGASGESQPIHVHNGSCTALGSIANPLTSVTDGRSITLLDATLASLRTGGLAINLHKSAQEISTYTACGDIPAVTSSITVALNERSSSGQSGYATLASLDSKTSVAIAVTPGAPPDVAQPIHVHNGSCTALGSIANPLTSVTDGRSITLLDATLASLRTGGLAINLHKSAQEISTYTACGDIPAAPQAASTPALTPTPTSRPPALTPTPASTTTSADIQNFTLPNLTVTVGTTVIWTNRDSVAHTSTGVGGKWQSGTLAPGQSFSHTFREIGTFEYFCEYHANMKGTVTVTLASGDYEY